MDIAYVRLAPPRPARSKISRALVFALLAGAAFFTYVLTTRSSVPTQNLELPTHTVNRMASTGYRSQFRPSVQQLTRSGDVAVRVMVPKDTPKRDAQVPNLSSANFTLKQMIGQMRPSGSNPNEKGKNNASVVNFFSATGRSVEITGESDEVPLLLKEYRGEAKKLALREIAVQARLRNAGEDITSLPVLPILGTFESKCIVHMTENGFSFGDKSLWTVESLNGITDTLVSYPYFPQKQHLTDKLPVIGPEMFLRRREAYIRKVVNGMITSLMKIHKNGIAHGALDMTSVLINTFDETKTKDVKVRFSNFGYAIDTNPEPIIDPSSAASLLIAPVEAAENNGKGELEIDLAREAVQAEDIYRMGLIFGELVYGAMSPEGPNARTHSSFLERRLRFKGFKVEGLREWSLEPSWTLVVDFLDKDKKAGWDLMQLLVKPPQELSTEEVLAQALNHRFFKDV